MSPDDLALWRREFSASTERGVYLDHAGVSPLPRSAVAGMTALAELVAATGSTTWLDRNDGVERVRALAARLLGARHVHEVAFVENTSTGLSAVAEGLPWQPGDEVVGAQPEFPSNAYPWMRLADHGVIYHRVPERDGRLDPDEILALLGERTRVLALSWVQFASGFRCDLARLGAACRERGIVFVVDAVQGLGALALDVEAAGIDVCAAACHKWLLGPEGVGLLYIADHVLERLRPPRSGWRSARDPLAWGAPERVTWNDGAPRFESGTLNIYGIHALGASLELLLAAGADTVERRVLALAERVARAFADAGFSLVSSRRPGETSGIVTATHGAATPEVLVERLAARGVTAAARSGRLRAAPHLYNTEEEIDRFGEALRAAIVL